MRTRKPYLTDLSDAEWALIEPYIPEPKTGGRPAKHPRREIVNAIFYLLRTGCQWRNLPHDFPPWQTVAYYFRLWRMSGLWEEVNDALRTELRKRHGRDASPSAAVVDSQSTATTEKGGSVAMMATRG